MMETSLHAEVFNVEELHARGGGVRAVRRMYLQHVVRILVRTERRDPEVPELHAVEFIEHDFGQA